MSGSGKYLKPHYIQSLRISRSLYYMSELGKIYRLQQRFDCVVVISSIDLHEGKDPQNSVPSMVGATANQRKEEI